MKSSVGTEETLDAPIDNNLDDNTFNEDTSSNQSNRHTSINDLEITNDTIEAQLPLQHTSITDQPEAQAPADIPLGLHVPLEFSEDASCTNCTCVSNDGHANDTSEASPSKETLLAVMKKPTSKTPTKLEKQAAASLMKRIQAHSREKGIVELPTGGVRK